jgi:hypothetical protein
MNVYKRTLTEAERAAVDDYTDDLEAELEAEGDAVTYYSDTSAGAVLHTTNKKFAVRMKACGEIVHTHNTNK